MRTLVLLLVLTACAPKTSSDTDTAGIADDSGEAAATLAPPWLAVVTATEPGTFRSDCVVTVDLVDAASGEAVSTATVGGDGGQWGGVEIAPGTQYRGTARWVSCTNNDYGAGESAISTFSGAAGDLFVFRYSGSLSSFETLVQEEDLAGGAATVVATDGAAVAALAGQLGVQAAEADGAWSLTWEGDTAVAEVLAAFTALETYERGAPVWIGEQPSWW